MPLTYTEAVDAVYSQFYDYWRTRAPVIVGYQPNVYWKGKEAALAVERSKFWVRVAQTIVDAPQTSISSCVGSDGGRRFGTHGLVTVQFFCPMSDPASMDKGRQLATIARDAFRAQTVGGLIFRNAKIVEIDPEGEANRFNVIAAFEYDEIS